jgi:beta-lactamase class A
MPPDVSAWSVTRRNVLAGAATAPVALGGAWAHADNGALAELERRSSGRLGVAALDSGSGRRVAYRADERFAMCSTSKFLSVATVLARVDRGEDRLDRVVPYGASDLLSYAPVTKANVGKGAMTLEALCAAAIEVSDNTAANLLLASFGGPAALTRYARSLGDGVTRLDRNEPTLNENLPGDPRDTTTPRAMLGDMDALLLGAKLTNGSRERLGSWMNACTTGGDRIRAGAPAGWRVGDKTGTGERGAANDIAILRPPHAAPVLVCIYSSTPNAPSPEARSAVIAAATKISLRSLGHGPDAHG